MKKASKRFVFLLLCLSFVLVADAQVHADTIGTDFENFPLGSVNGQSGWTSGQGNSSCLPFDVAVVSNTYGYASFGMQSLRISNGITCGGSFAGQLRSPLLANEAGETTAASSTSPLGIRQPYFEAQWDFASAQPGSEQPGLSVAASPDDGTGSRMSWLEMLDTSSGLELDFKDFQTSVSNFVITPIATGIDRTIPHTVKITMQFIDGSSNDIVKIYLDGALIHTGGSWEDYSRSVGGTSSAVDSVMFRIIDPAATTTLGKGFLIDNFSSESGPIPSTASSTPTVSSSSPSVIPSVSPSSGNSMNSGMGGHQSANAGNQNVIPNNQNTINQNTLTTVTTTTVVSSPVPDASIMGAVFNTGVTAQNSFNFLEDATQLQTLIASDTSMYSQSLAIGYPGPLTLAGGDTFQVKNTFASGINTFFSTLWSPIQAALQKVFSQQRGPI